MQSIERQCLGLRQCILAAYSLGYLTRVFGSREAGIYFAHLGCFGLASQTMHLLEPRLLAECLRALEQ